MAEAVIVDSVRTGLAKSFRGGFNQTRADNMTAYIVDALMDRNPRSRSFNGGRYDFRLWRSRRSTGSQHCKKCGSAIKTSN